MSLGNRLKKLRESKNLKQEDIANVIGIKRSSYANYERDTRFSNIEFLIKLGEYYGVTLDYLIKGDYGSNLIKLEESSIKAIPVVKELSNGKHSIRENIDHLKSYIIPESEPDKYFLYYLTKEDMCFQKMGIGDLVLFEVNESISEEDICLVLIEELELMVGKVQINDDITIFKPYNPKYNVQIFKKNEIDSGKLKVIGKAISASYNIESHKGTPPKGESQGIIDDMRHNEDIYEIQHIEDVINNIK